MSAKLVKFQLNEDAVRTQILQADWMGAYMLEVANGYQMDGYEITQQQGQYRWRTQIEAVTDEAIQDCYDNNTLIKVVGI